MHPRTTTQSHHILKNDKNEKLEVIIHVPALQAEGLGLITWASSAVLANHLHRVALPEQSLKGHDGISVLELGAGTGLVGLSAAAIWQTDVVITELEPIVPCLVDNITANEKLLLSSNGNARAGTLDWNEPDRLILGGASNAKQILTSTTDKARIILAVDVIYCEEHPRMLVNAILAWLKPGSDSRLVLTYPLRIPYIDYIRDLWERLEAGGLEAIEEGREEIQRDEWDDEPLIEWCIWKWKS